MLARNNYSISNAMCFSQAASRKVTCLKWCPFFRRVVPGLRLLDALNVLPRAAETARILGIDMLSVLSRGSQFRVEGFYVC